MCIFLVNQDSQRVIVLLNTDRERDTHEHAHNIDEK